MSMMLCSYCSELTDTDDAECQWDVPKFIHPRKTSDIKYEMVCGICAEKYINEDGELDHNLEERQWDAQQEKLMEEAP